jgi:phosphatidylserine/phosphatidylglycerophosphate/cardiolipin synthase-like enzyme
MEFITNRELLLKQVMENIIPSSENLYFLIGYFYFSGFDLLKDAIKDKNLKILVGMDIEKDLNNQIMEYFYLKDKENYIPDSEIKKKYCQSIKSVFETDIFDNKDGFDRYRLFKQKLENGSLEVRKTREPNHAKLYIFVKKRELDEGGLYPGAVITGSSNLSYSGIKSQYEINVLSRDKREYEEAYKIFCSLWQESIKFLIA